MKIKEIFESTTAGCVATIAMPIGGVIKRNPDSFFGAVTTSEEFPNTPEWMKQNKPTTKKKKNVK